ncbi:hypothetical protein BGZ88_010310 [Linnemannia elongata]|nr:hypothetical protein BGZ88_010310 [Linnemannia elongata]
MTTTTKKTSRRQCVCGSAEDSGFMRDCNELGGGASFDNHYINICICTVKSQDKERKGRGDGDCEDDVDGRANGYKKGDKGNGREFDIRTQSYSNDGGTKGYDKEGEVNSRGVNNRAKQYEDAGGGNSYGTDSRTNYTYDIERRAAGFEKDGKGEGTSHGDSGTKTYDNAGGAKI